jgi:hypothetical protein
VSPVDDDFCRGCSEYLRWEPTGAVPLGLVHADPIRRLASPARTLPGSARRGGVAITLWPDGGTPSAGSIPSVEIVPGQRASLRARVTNQSGVVDSYRVAVEGVPDGWWSVRPQSVDLLPHGARGGEFEAEVEITLHPPRDRSAQAREWPLRVAATSRSRGERTATAPLLLRLDAYMEANVELRPARATGRKRARFACLVRNVGNAPLTVAVSASEPEARCRFRTRPEHLRVAPGATGVCELTVVAPRWITIGRALERPIEVGVTPVGADVCATAVAGTFSQRPWLPWWITPVVLISIAVAMLAWALLVEFASRGS